MEARSASGGVEDKILDKQKDLQRCLDNGLISHEEHSKLHASLQEGRTEYLKKGCQEDDTKIALRSIGDSKTEQIQLKRADLSCAKENGLISIAEYTELQQRLDTPEIDIKLADLLYARNLGLLSPSEHDTFRAQLVGAGSSSRSEAKKDIKLADLLSARQLGLITDEEHDRFYQQLNAGNEGHAERSAYTRGFEGGASAGFERGFDSSVITTPLSVTSAGDDTFLAGYEVGFVEGFNRGLALRQQQQRR